MTLGERDWHELERRHRAFWACASVDRPLILTSYRTHVRIDLLAQVLGEGRVEPKPFDLAPFLEEYDRIALARELVGDDLLAAAEPPVGIPWMEAICGCPVMSGGPSVWPEPAENPDEMTEIRFSSNNPWLRLLLQIQQRVTEHVAGRYPVAMSHLRGPTDILVALLGSSRFFLSFYDERPEFARMAQQAADAWRQVVRAQMEVVPAYRDGYVLRALGLWAPETTVWLQDDTSGMMSLDHYRRYFLQPMVSMSVLPYGVCHLHMHSLHVMETLAQVPNIRAIELSFDSKTVGLQEALPTLRRLQERKVALILQGLSLEEYDGVMDALSPRGLALRLKSESLEEARVVMAHVRERARRHSP